MTTNPNQITNQHGETADDTAQWESDSYQPRHRQDPGTVAAARRAFAGLQPGWEETLSLDELNKLFKNHYVGSYPDLFEAAHALTEIGQVEIAVDQIMGQYFEGKVIRIHYDLLYESMRQRWEIVEGDDGVVHLFDR